MPLPIRWRSGLLGAAAGLLLAPLASLPAPADPPSGNPAFGNAPATEPPRPSHPAAARQQPAKVRRVTLVTGDVVRLVPRPDGGFQTDVRPARRPDRAEVTFLTLTSPKGETYVIPSDAQDALAKNILDWQLFNVTYLAKHGFADGKTNELPLIVTYRDRVGARTTDGSGTDALTRRSERLPGVDDPIALTSIDGAGVAVDKVAADDLWARLASGSATRPQDRSRTMASLGRQVTGVWLDQPVQATLDESVPLVGAPEAWDAGHDGTGATVAVLDTGVDATHPDLADQVVAAESFVNNPVQDDHGHGTHIASTISGSGAASDGQYRGVAPGADLVVGRVLNSAGSGTTAEIIQGMEWATQEQDADIVSMSLGGAHTDGTDPLSQAVNDLTASTGALFVVAAGNDGPGLRTVATPGTADAALTVAATTKSDEVAEFSGRGPRVGDQALKPEIAAPGVHIAAARADGTALCQSACVQPGDGPVDEHYTAASGTSMATPHVAGAAAILAQRHPDWSPAQLKAALITASQELPQADVHEVGGGRLDIPRTLAQQLHASPGVVDFGLASPTDPPDPRTVTLTNPTSEPMNVTVAAELRDANGDPVEGRLHVTPETATVPAGGTTDVTVGFDTDGPNLGEITGALRVRDAAGTELLRLPIGGVNETWRRVPVRVVPPPAPARMPTTVTLARVDEYAEPISVSIDPDTHRGTAYLAEGEYFALAGAGYYAADGVRQQVLLIESEATVAKGTEIVVDGSTLTRFKPDVNRPTDLLDLRTTIQRGLADPEDGSWTVQDYAGAGLGAIPARLSITPTDPVEVGTMDVSTQAELAQPKVRLSVPGQEELTLDASYAHHHLAKPQVDLNGRFDLVDVGEGSATEVGDVDLTGKLALVEVSRESGLGPPANVNKDTVWPIWQRLADAGAAGAVVHSGDERPTWLRRPVADDGQTVSEVALPLFTVGTDDGARLAELAASERVRLSVRSRSESAYSYTLRMPNEHRVPTQAELEIPRSQLVEIDSRYFAPVPMDVRRNVWTDTAEGVALGTVSWHSGGTARTELMGPVDPDVLWWRGTTVHNPSTTTLVNYFSNEGYVQHAFDVWSEPGHHIESWFDGPVIPSGGGELDAAYRLWESLGRPAYGGTGSTTTDVVACEFCRNANGLLIMLPSGGSGPAHHWSWIPRLRGGIETHLYRDGTEIDPLAPFAWALPDDPAPAKYRLTHRFPPQSGEWYGGIQVFMHQDADVRTTWDFWSQNPSDGTSPRRPCFPSGPCEQQPLLLVDYDFGQVLRLDNTAPAPELVRLPVRVSQLADVPEKSRVVGFEAEVSYDGGETWESVRSRKLRNGEYEVQLHHPRPQRTSGTVSLRVEAWDDAGNRVKQTVLDAYRLTSR